MSSQGAASPQANSNAATDWSGPAKPGVTLQMIAPGRSVPKAVFPMKWEFTIPRSNSPDAKPEELLAFALTDMVMEKAI